MTVANGELLRLVVREESDVFLVRQRGRQVAAVVGLDAQDQIRVATALSDLGRELVRNSVTVAVAFWLRTRPSPALVVELTWRGDPPTGSGGGWDTARRLMDEVRPTENGLVLLKAVPARTELITSDVVGDLRDRIQTSGGGNSLDELRIQNQQLLETLEDLQTKTVGLERLNAELEETNQGVLALYQQLTDELEQTNQGVVALYAELDEKSARLRESAEARTRFWSNISHELRAPINSVVGLARLLGSTPETLDADQRHQVQLINHSGATLLALVNELLDTAKAESGSLVPVPAPVALDYVFAELRGTLQPTLRSAEVELVVDPLPPLPLLLSDETILVRILRNLLSNAVKFTERGEVRLSARHVPGSGDLRFVVRDTGIGIPVEEQDKVFEEFYQVPGPAQVGTTGTGLGLPYARTLAQLLGGELTLTSEPGVGTEVSLVLPLGGGEVVEDVRFGRALVVDGDAEARDRLRESLDGVAGHVLEAGDGRAALALAKRERPDLIFLSASTPLMSGSAILSVLRLDPDLREVPVVVVCGDDPGALARTMSGLGAALLDRSRTSAQTVRRAVREARVAVRAAVPR
ncbi:ATP-binding protein [Actinokineospora pegani]|uniref:ATP-binding protein n=1 Tax=Actinokineospora pegani TaxID=2654637 RepID=UPI0012E9EB59|nr:ATP-binding protein [Actinokineospora pegani]